MVRTVKEMIEEFGKFKLKILEALEKHGEAAYNLQKTVSNISEITDAIVEQIGALTGLIEDSSNTIRIIEKKIKALENKPWYKFWK